MKYANRVLETTTSTGTGDLTLAGTVVGYRTFASAFLTADEKFIYCIDAGAAFEIGIGHLSGGSLVRDTLIESTTGAKLDLAAGEKKIFNTVPGQRISDFMWDKIAGMQVVSMADALVTKLVGESEATVALDMALARCFSVQIDGSPRSVSLTVINQPIVPDAKQEITIYVKSTTPWIAPFSIVMPAGWKWGRDYGGAAQTSPAQIVSGAQAAFTGTTLDGGATWLGSVLGRGW